MRPGWRSSREMCSFRRLAPRYGCRPPITRTFPSRRCWCQGTWSRPSSRSIASRAPPTTSPTRATPPPRSGLPGSTRSSAHSMRSPPEMSRRPRRFPISPRRSRGIACRSRRCATSCPRSGRTSPRIATRAPPDLFDYCRRSANPIGRLLLHLYGAATPANERASDAICTALQLINFWQDVAADWQRGRVYLPQEDLRRFGVDKSQIARGPLRSRVARADGVRNCEARARCSNRVGRSRARCRGASRSSSRACSPAATGSSTASTRRAATCSATARPSPASTGPSSPAARCFRRAATARPAPGPPHDPRRVLRAAGRAQRLQLLLQLHVPAAASGGARSPRSTRSAAKSTTSSTRSAIRPSRAPSSPGGAPRSAPRSPGRRSIPVAQALAPLVREFPLQQEQLQMVIDGMAMDLERHRYVDFDDLAAVLRPRRRRRRAHVGRDLRLREPGDAPSTRAISASRSSSPTSSATSARTRAAAASTCRRTSSRATGSPRPRCSGAKAATGSAR